MSQLDEAHLSWLPVASAIVNIGTAAFGILGQSDAPPRYAWAALAVAPCLLYLFRRALPLWVRMIVALGAISIARPASDSVLLFLVILLCGEGATIGTPLQTIATMAASLGTIGWLAAQQSPLAPWFGWIGGAFLALASGRMVQHQARLLAQLRAAQSELASQAAAEERRRIAREVHDLIAHSLTVTMLHLTGARLTLQNDGDTEEAIAGLAEAERLGRQSLADIRRTVGLLGSANGDTPTAPPLPGALEVDSLVQGYAAAGLAVTLQAYGEARDVSPATGLALYRIVQESLAKRPNTRPAAPRRSRSLTAPTGWLCPCATVRLRTRLRTRCPPTAVGSASPGCPSGRPSSAERSPPDPMAMAAGRSGATCPASLSAPSRRDSRSAGRRPAVGARGAPAHPADQGGVRGRR